MFYFITVQIICIIIILIYGIKKILVFRTYIIYELPE